LSKCITKLKNTEKLKTDGAKKFKDKGDDYDEDNMLEVAEEIAGKLEVYDYEWREKMMTYVRMNNRFTAAVDYFTPAANRFANLPDMSTFGHRILQETAECMKLCEKGGVKRDYAPPIEIKEPEVIPPTPVANPTDEKPEADNELD